MTVGEGCVFSDGTEQVSRHVGLTVRELSPASQRLTGSRGSTRARLRHLQRGGVCQEPLPYRHVANPAHSAVPGGLFF